MLDSSICKAVVDTAKQSCEGFRGALIFGSQIGVCADGHSDIDLLVAVESGIPFQQKRTVENYAVDIEILSIQDLTGALDQKRWKNNLVLLALHTGVIVSDSCRTLVDFQFVARELWRLGTGPLSEIEKARIRVGAIKVRDSVEKVCARFDVSRSEYDRALLTSHFHTIHLSALTIYMRSFDKWVFPPWVFSKLTDLFYVHLREMSAEILCERNLSKASLLTCALMDKAIDRLVHCV